MELIEHRPYNSGGLVSISKVKHGGIIFNEVKLFKSASGYFASLGDKPLFERDGTPIRNEKGRLKYVKIAAFADADTAARFTTKLIELIETRFGPLSGDAA